MARVHVADGGARVVLVAARLMSAETQRLAVIVLWTPLLCVGIHVV